MEVEESVKKDEGDKWTLEELDLNRSIVSLYSILDDKQLLVEKIFSILSSREIKQITPQTLQGIPLSILKDMCIIELKDHSIFSDEELMSTLVDADQEFTVKHTPVTEPSKQEPVVEEVRQVEETSTAPAVVVTTEVQSAEEASIKQELLPSEVDVKLKESYVSKGLVQLEDLDLSRPVVGIESLVGNGEKLSQLLLSLIPDDELVQMLPDSLKAKSLDQIKREVRTVICDLPPEVIEALLNESNSSLKQESELNLIKSDCSLREEKEKTECATSNKEQDTEARMKDGSTAVKKIPSEPGDRKKDQEKEDDDGADMDMDEETGNEDQVESTLRLIATSANSREEELALLEKQAQEIRQKLKDIEEKEARIKALAGREKKKRRVEEAADQDKGEDDCPVSQEKPFTDIESDIIINRVMEDDEDSIDRELKGEEM